MAGLEGEQPEKEQGEVVYEIRLPCGHMVEQPSTSVHIQCRWDLRKWHLTYKGGEWLAREE